MGILTKTTLSDLSGLSTFPMNVSSLTMDFSIDVSTNKHTNFSVSFWVFLLLQPESQSYIES